MSSIIRKHRELPPQKRALVDVNINGVGVPLEEDFGDRWCSLPTGFGPKFEEIYNFEIYDDDVFLVTFPKSGTTWIQEAIWLLLNDLDYITAKTIHLRIRSIFLELETLYPHRQLDTIKLAAELKRPRLIQTHLPAQLLPYQIWQKKTKIIYCARNLKDVVVSFYHFLTALGTFKGTLDEFAEDIINQDIKFTPFWPHVLDFWKMRHEPNIFFVTYEEMKRDLKAVLRKLNQFLGKPELEVDKLEELFQHLSFENMRDNDKVNQTQNMENELNIEIKNFRHMRRGVVGGYKDELSEESQRKLEEYTRKSFEGQQVTQKDIFGIDL